MALSCPVPTGSSVIQNLAGYVDCHAQGLGEAGFQSLTGGVLFPAFLSGCLTIYVAILGYRVALGQTLTVREAVLAALRVGLVVTLCTRWPSYETLVYRVATVGPGEIAGAVLQATNLPLLELDDLASRLDAAYQTIETQPVQRAEASGISLAPPGLPQSPRVPTAADAARLANVPVGLTVAGSILMVSSVGSLLAIRLAAAILLAMGPLFIALALFESMIGLMVGWLRALAATIIASTGLMVVAGLEVAFLESQLATSVGAGAPLLTDQSLLAVAFFFATMMLAVIATAALVAKGFSLPQRFQSRWHEAIGAASSSTTQAQQPDRERRQQMQPEGRSRAQSIVDAVARSGDRASAPSFTNAVPSYDGASRRAVIQTRATASPATEVGAFEALGYSLRRSAGTRRSGTAARRDSRR